jgi:hypothetical protein
MCASTCYLIGAIAFLAKIVIDIETRYRLLETIREYGEERLDEAGETDRWRAAAELGPQQGGVRRDPGSAQSVRLPARRLLQRPQRIPGQPAARRAVTTTCGRTREARLLRSRAPLTSISRGRRAGSA